MGWKKRCRNSYGQRHIYKYRLYNKDNLAFDPSDVSKLSNYWGSIAADTLRIMKIEAEPITDYLGAGIFSIVLLAQQLLH